MNIYLDKYASDNISIIRILKYSLSGIQTELDALDLISNPK